MFISDTIKTTFKYSLKEQFRQKRKLFTRPHFIPNPYAFFFHPSSKMCVDITDSNIALVLTCVVTEHNEPFLNSEYKQARNYINHTKHMTLEY